MWTWIVLKREPFVAYWQFYSRKDAKDFAQREGGQMVEVDDAIGGHTNSEGTVIWFNGNWDHPVAKGMFFDVADATAYTKDLGSGIAVELEYPDDNEPIILGVPIDFSGGRLR